MAAFLAPDFTAPAALVLEGEPGIGKTTLWLAGVERAREHGFHVLASRPAAAESALSYSSLSDLLGGVDTAVRSELPDPQRLALDHVLLRADAGGVPTDPRAVSAALLSVLERLAVDAPVLVAIDDLQWLDVSSAHAIAFAARRLSGRVLLFATTRGDRHSVAATSWLHLPTPDAIHRVPLRPLDIGGLREVITDRLGRSFPRPTMLKIQEVARGNPFYGLELARSLEGHTLPPTSLPASLAELVNARVDSLDQNVRSALLAVACLAVPTVELVARAVGTGADDLVAQLADAESTGIVEIDGRYLRFAHPLLGMGVYTNTSSVLRRAMHEVLADLVEELESRARHLALAATSATHELLESLDVAAELASTRGAPAAAAELLDLGLGLGGDTPARQIRSAGHHLEAGNLRRAKDLLNQALAQLAPGGLRARALVQLAVVELFDDSVGESAALLERALGEVDGNFALRAQVLVMLSFALLNEDRFTEGGNEKAEEAVVAAVRSGVPSLVSQALGARAMIRFIQGRGHDQPGMRRALEMEDPDANIAIMLRATVENALLLGWSGQLADAKDALVSICRGCLERGEESELVRMSFHTCLVELWFGDFVEAGRRAEDTVERARQLGGDIPQLEALTIRALARSYAGQEAGARSDLTEAMAAGARCGMNTTAEWTVTVLGFLETSLGNYEAALAALTPLMRNITAALASTEIIAASFVPDAVEALIELGRLDEADPLIELFERNGRRLDRPWMLAVGGRGRGMLLAARGDLDGAHGAVLQAMGQHDRIPMPFERARTRLLLGELQRRLGHEQAAMASFAEAWQVFERLGTPLWSARARVALDGNDIRRPNLSPSEQRVARLTASGMTNGEVAAALFISPKTVEFHLARVYRKLGIRSRAELGRLVHDLN